ncbi:MAG: adenylate/guanylate cyclase domain-containing protein [Aquabacterium sp.]
MDASEAFHAGGSPMLDWLASVGLAHLEPVLRRHDIAEDVLTSLNERDLAEMGLSLGDRKRFMRAIARMLDAGEHARGGSVAPPANLPVHTELRQLTILFCDVVGATSLSMRLPPETWRDVVLAYQRTAAELIARHGGSVAQYLGDGLLVYFGYPQAREDAAVRAVQCALSLVSALGALAMPALAQPLRTRIGVHTGMVVVGDVGAGLRHEPLALGEAPHLAARLQALARPDTVLISQATRQLAAGHFEYEDAGLHALKGIAEPRQVWRVRAARPQASRFEARRQAGQAGLSPLVGRADLLALLADRWRLATCGQGQVVVISGEAGMGKSRLIRAWLDRIDLPDAQHIEGQCLPHAIDEPWHAWRALIAAPACPPHVDEVSEAVRAALQQRAAVAPVCLVIEDAHWADPASRDVLAAVARQVASLPALMLITARPSALPDGMDLPHITRIRMSGLHRAEVGALMTHLGGGQVLPPAVAQQILQRSGGVPLFVEEMTRNAFHQPDPQAPIPDTLRDALMARLDAHPLARRVAQVGALIGHEFSERLLRQVCSDMRDAELDAALQALCDDELVLRYESEGGTMYVFRQALAHQAASDSLPPSRQQAVHARVLACLLTDDAVCATSAGQARLARHAAGAGRPDEARAGWQGAGDMAWARGALHEARTHWQHALQSLQTEPAGPARDEAALNLHVRLGGVHVHDQGWAAGDAAMAYQTACEAGARLPRPGPMHAIAWWGLALHHGWRSQPGELLPCRDALINLAGPAPRDGEEGPPALVHAMAKACEVMHHLACGRFDMAARCVPEWRAMVDDLAWMPMDPHVHAQAQGILAAWILGRHDDIDGAMAPLLSRARLPMSQAVVCLHAAWLHMLADQPQAMLPWLHRVESRWPAHGGLAWMQATAQFAKGWWHARTARMEEDVHARPCHEGLALMQRAIHAHLQHGLRSLLPCQYALLAEAQSLAGLHEEAMESLSQAWSATVQTGQRWHEAELHRIRAECLSRQPGPDLVQALASVQQARAVAHSQQATRWASRARSAMSRLAPDLDGSATDPEA